MSVDNVNGEPAFTDLLSGRRLTRNALWNLVGGIAPMLVGLVAIPLLIGEMGTARFGVLAVAWVVVGYFSLFDFGLGRALTKLVAEKLGGNAVAEVPAVVWTTLAFQAVLGILGALLFVALAPWVVEGVLKVPSGLQQETVTAFYIVGATIPIVITSATLRGLLEAYQRFGLINAVRIPLGMLTFLGPLAVMPFSNSLVAVVAVLGVARLVAWIAISALCLHVSPDLRHPARLRGDGIRRLLSFGGWMTVSNIVSPLMEYLDRFWIGATISMVAVAYYATPYELITRLGIIPTALMGVVFPALSTALAHDRARAARLYRRTSTYLFFVMFPVVLAVVTLAEPALDLWVGDEFASNSTRVLQVLAVGILVNSLARLPFALVQADDRPDLTAKLHMVELPFYLLALWILLQTMGIIGAALAWTARVSIDAMVLFLFARPILKADPGRPVRLPQILAISLAMLATGAILPGLPAKVGFLVAAVSLFVFQAWRRLLQPSDRDAVRAAFKRPAMSKAR